jgi:hypothetical protein
VVSPTPRAPPSPTPMTSPSPIPSAPTSPIPSAPTSPIPSAPTSPTPTPSQPANGVSSSMTSATLSGSITSVQMIYTQSAVTVSFTSSVAVNNCRITLTDGSTTTYSSGIVQPTRNGSTYSVSLGTIGFIPITCRVEINVQ